MTVVYAAKDNNFNQEKFAARIGYKLKIRPLHTTMMIDERIIPKRIRDAAFWPIELMQYKSAFRFVVSSLTKK